MNLKKYYFYRLFEDLMPIYPLYLLMFEEHGLSILEISALLAIWSVPAILLEVPTGVLADRWNRKNLIALGGLLKACCYLTWFLGEGFFCYAIGFLLWGMGGTLRSGAEEALLFDTLKLQGQEERFDLIYGKGHFLSGISNVLAAVSGGLIGMRSGFRPALLLSVLTGCIAAVLAYSMQEVNLYKITSSHDNEEKNGGTLRSAICFLVKDKVLFLFAILSLLVITTSGILDEYDQLIAKNYGLTIRMIGIWSAIRFILMAIGGYLAHGLRKAIENIFKIKDGFYTLSILCLTAAICLMIAGLVNKIGIMVLYGLYYFLLAAGGVLQEDYVQQNINSEGRSTVHSLLSLAQNLYGILCYGLFGLVVSGATLPIGLVVCGIYIVLGTAGICGIYIRIRKS